MSHLCENEVYRACRTLFGPELQVNRSFLSYLQPSGVRSAYRRQAKELHPDRFAVAAADIRKKQHHLFQDLNQAHQTIQHFLKLRQTNKSIGTPPAAQQRPKASRAKPQGRNSNQPHQGLPPYPLQFGLFLYYLGIVPFKELISAITSQRRQRPQMGDIAKRWGWLNDFHIRQIIAHRGKPLRFGEKAEQLGLLTAQQVRTLLYYQRTRQQQLGEYFVEQGLLDRDTLHDLLGQLAAHNRKFRKDYSGQYYYYHA
ncbi:J domain-containing protein [Pelovirga terrestris]|uniref:J domain-containing protein n=1 Tax=Pelovirga terrestris TaxID=2771352 RepID=A0A8J6UGF6_9BACT|nr:J domain-containing protein [Pelovirga terrestris]MBD1399673.1 hypothetical protein [Pelovirga terrestris]